MNQGGTADIFYSSLAELFCLGLFLFLKTFAPKTSCPTKISNEKAVDKNDNSLQTMAKIQIFAANKSEYEILQNYNSRF